MNCITVTHNELHCVFQRDKKLSTEQIKKNVVKYITNKFEIEESESVISQIETRLRQEFYNNYIVLINKL